MIYIFIVATQFMVSGWCTDQYVEIVTTKRSSKWNHLVKCCGRSLLHSLDEIGREMKAASSWSIGYFQPFSAH